MNVIKSNKIVNSSKLTILTLLISSCSALNNKDESQFASVLVISKIEYIENQLDLYQKEKKADFIKEVNEIVNLSEIKPIEKHFTGSDYIVYIPTKEDINNWKEWYANNKGKFYYSPNDKCLTNIKMTKSERKKIIFIEVEPSLIRSTISSNMKDLCKNFQ